MSRPGRFTATEHHDYQQRAAFTGAFSERRLTGMAEYQIKGRRITLIVNPDTQTYAVEIAGQRWTMSDNPYVLFENGERIEFPAPQSQGLIKTGTTEGAAAVYTGFGSSNITVRTKAEIEAITDDVYFTVQVENDERCEIRFVSFPAPFDYGAKYGDIPAEGRNHLPVSYTVLSRMQGALIPAGLQIELGSGLVYDRDSYMPMFGQVRGNTGYLGIYDTPFDVHYELRYSDGEKVAPLWKTSLGHIAYPRRMLYRFMTDCDHNDFAASYRAYVKERGRLITLKQKIAKNPNIEKLIGCPVIHSDIATHISPDSFYYHPDDPAKNDFHTPFSVRADQLRELHRKGLKKGYTHFDGWGRHGYDNLHPDVLPPHEAAGGVEGMRELAETTTSLGYIFGIHDQYRDYYYDADSFDPDNAVMEADGSHMQVSHWYGGRQTIMCSSLSRDYVRRNYQMLEELGIRIEASYLDVFSVVPLDECFNPAHPVTREQSAQYRRECLEYLTSKGIINSSEEVLDCVLPAQVLCHHAPFYTTDWESKEADPIGIPIPLLNMVYHDCLVVPWIGRKLSRGGWGIPRSDSGYAHAWLNGGPQYLSIDADEAEIAEVDATCAMAEKLAHQTIVKHEFISADRRTQRTTFSDGTVIEVNFDTDEVTVR